MTEKKLKPAAKKVTPSKTGIRKNSAVSSKPEGTKTTAATGAKKTSAKKPVAKKTSVAATKPKKAKTTTAKKAATLAAGKKTPVRKAQAEKAVAMPTPEERYRMVETAAYFIAERHGFQGRSDEHWAAAEFEVAARLGR